MKPISANSALIQPKDRDYKSKGKKREEHLEIKNDEIAHALRAGVRNYVAIEFEEVSEMNNIRIRKLTPTECYKLMGFTAEDCLAVKVESREVAEELLKKYPNHFGKRVMTEAERINKMSNAQLYKQAGNSIVVNVLEAIFTSLGERYEEFRV